MLDAATLPRDGWRKFREQGGAKLADADRIEPASYSSPEMSPKEISGASAGAFAPPDPLRAARLGRLGFARTVRHFNLFGAGSSENTGLGPSFPPERTYRRIVQ